MIKKENILLVPSQINLFIESYKQKLPALESGGIILGRIMPDQHVIIDELTHPSPKDKRGWFRFERDRGTAQEIINNRWTETNGERIYLGEWHTHNEKKPRPSGRDLKMIHNQLKTSKMEIDFLLLLIIGQEECYYGIETTTGHKQIAASNNPFCYYIESKPILL